MPFRIPRASLIPSPPQEPSQPESAPSVPRASTSGARAPAAPPGQPQGGDASMRPRLMQLLNQPQRALELETAKHLERWEYENNSGPNAAQYKQVAEKVRECLKMPGITTLAINAPNITSLPPIPVHITKLDLSHCYALTSPPDVSGCSSLTSLNLSKCGSLKSPPDLSGCPLLTSLDLRECRALRSPPNVSGSSLLTSLDLSHCHALRSPPDLLGCSSLAVLNLSDCHSLTSPPDLSECSSLAALNLRECYALTSPPNASGCSLLTSLDLMGCRALTSPPDVSGCSSLTSLDLTGCNSLTSPPDVSGCASLTSLKLLGCSALTNPPDVSRCSSLTSLNLMWCRALTSPPIMAHHPQLATLNMNDVPLTSLPETILSLPQSCTISLTAYNLSEEVRNRLAAAMNIPGYTGPQISYDMSARRGIAAKPINEEVARWKKESARWKKESGATGDAQSDALWKGLQGHDNAHSFAQFLVRLRETSDYKRARSQPNFQQRIGRLLAQLEQADNAALRELCFAQAAEAVETCGDRVALSLLHMETACATYQAEVKVRNGGYDNQLQDLVDLAKGMYRLQQLEEISRAKVKTLNFVDEIEVYLGYLVHFSKEFNLPVQMETMLYPRCSQITEADVIAARNTLTGHEETFLANWAPMDMMMKKLDADGFSAMTIKIKTSIEKAKGALYTQLAELDEKAEDYKQKADLLMADYNQISATIASREKRQFVAELLHKNNGKALSQ